MLSAVGERVLFFQKNGWNDENSYFMSSTRADSRIAFNVHEENPYNTQCVQGGNNMKSNRKLSSWERLDCISENGKINRLSGWKHSSSSKELNKLAMSTLSPISEMEKLKKHFFPQVTMMIFFPVESSQWNQKRPWRGLKFQWREEKKVVKRFSTLIPFRLEEFRRQCRRKWSKSNLK